MSKNRSETMRKKMKEEEFSFVFQEMTLTDEIIIILLAGVILAILFFNILPDILTYIF